MIDYDFSLKSTDDLNSLVEHAEGVLERVTTKLDKLKELDTNVSKDLMDQYEEINSWITRAKCELFERKQKEAEWTSKMQNRKS